MVASDSVASSVSLPSSTTTSMPPRRPWPMLATWVMASSWRARRTSNGTPGTFLHYGGNNEDSWQAGYILYWYENKFLWGIQMNANGSDGPIQCEGFGPGEYTICGTYKDGLAQLWVDDELAGEQECNWCMAEGGLLSLCSGSHQEGDAKDEAPEGSIAISNVYIATQ